MRLPEKDEFFFQENNIFLSGALKQQEISVITRCMESTYSFTSVSGTTEQALPADFIEVLEVKYEDKPLVFLPEKPSVEDYPDADPTGYYIFGNTIGFYPTPNVTGDTVDMRYKRMTPEYAGFAYAVALAGSTACTVNVDATQITYTVTGGTYAGAHNYAHVSGTASLTLTQQTAKILANAAHGYYFIQCPTAVGYHSSNLRNTYEGAVNIFTYPYRKYLFTEVEIPVEMHSVIAEGILADMRERELEYDKASVHRKKYFEGIELFRRKYPNRYANDAIRNVYAFNRTNMEPGLGTVI